MALEDTEPIEGQLSSGNRSYPSAQTAGEPSVWEKLPARAMPPPPASVRGLAADRGALHRGNRREPAGPWITLASLALNRSPRVLLTSSKYPPTKMSPSTAQGCSDTKQAFSSLCPRLCWCSPPLSCSHEKPLHPPGRRERGAGNLSRHLLANLPFSPSKRPNK